MSDRRLPTLSAADFDRWLVAYGRAWETSDPAAVAVLFATDAIYHETPFDPPLIGVGAIEAYWREGAGQAQRDVVFQYDIIAVSQDRGVSQWTASFVRVPSGIRVHLDGMLAARFDADGRCIEFREWWHRREEAPDG